MSNGTRRLLKTLSWSLIALSVTTGVGWISTGSLIKGGAIGLICRAIKIPAFWMHDAAWDKAKVEDNLHAIDGMSDVIPCGEIN